MSQPEGRGHHAASPSLSSCWGSPPPEPKRPRGRGRGARRAQTGVKMRGTRTSPSRDPPPRVFPTEAGCVCRCGTQLGRLDEGWGVGLDGLLAPSRAFQFTSISEGKAMELFLHVFQKCELSALVTQWPLLPTHSLTFCGLSPVVNRGLKIDGRLQKSTIHKR